MRVYQFTAKIKNVMPVDFDKKNIMQHKFLAFYKREEFPSAKKMIFKMNEAIGFKSSEELC